MARIKYFADIMSETYELAAIRHVGPGTKKASDFSGLLPSGTRVLATRMIEMKSNPSRHECDARCMFASGRTMRCECACGGKNHGKGSAITCEAA
jgi:hypothetical protein